MRRRLLRGAQVFGLSLGALGLAGTALMFGVGMGGVADGATQARAVAERAELTVLVAGRDVAYCGYHLRCEDQMQRVGLFQPINTDTLMLVRVRGTQADILNIPRDTNVGEFDPEENLADQKINSQYWQGGPHALVRGVEEITGSAIDGYVVLNEEYVAQAIDRLGGLDVVIPEGGIQWTDNAAGIDLDLPAGPRHLSGEEAALYLRVRKGFGDDWGRIDHQKQALTQLLARLRSPQGMAAMPGLVSGFLGNVESNLSPDQVAALSPHLPKLKLNFATLPTQPIQGTFNLAADWDALGKLWDNPALEAYREEQKREATQSALWDEGWNEGAQQIDTGATHMGGVGVDAQGAGADEPQALPVLARPVLVLDGSGELLGPALARALRRIGYTDVQVLAAAYGAGGSPESETEEGGPVEGESVEGGAGGGLSSRGLPSQIQTRTEPELAASLGALLGLPTLQGERFEAAEGTADIWLGEDAPEQLAALLPTRRSGDVSELRLPYHEARRLLRSLSVPLAESGGGGGENTGP